MLSRTVVLKLQSAWKLPREPLKIQIAGLHPRIYPPVSDSIVLSRTLEFVFIKVIYLKVRVAVKEIEREKVRKRERKKQKERETKVFHPLVHSSDGCNSQGWTRLKPGASSGYPTWMQGPKHPEHTPLLSQATSRQLDWKWSNCKTNQHPMGCHCHGFTS